MQQHLRPAVDALVEVLVRHRCLVQAQLVRDDPTRMRPVLDDEVTQLPVVALDGGLAGTHPLALGEESAVIPADSAFLRRFGGRTRILWHVHADDAYAASCADDLDQVVGRYSDSSGTHSYYRDAAGNVSPLDYPGASGTAVTGINDAGDIVGYYLDSSSQVHGFVDDAGNFQTFDISGSLFTLINGINNNGDISGTYFDAQGAHAFLTVGPQGTAVQHAHQLLLALVPE